MESQFSSNLHVIDAPEFHGPLKAVFKDSCVCGLKEQALVDHPEIINEENFCGLRLPIDKTPDIQPHFQWLAEAIEIHHELFTQIKASGGRFEFSMIQAVRGSRGSEITLSAANLRILGSLDASFKMLVFHFGKRPNDPIPTAEKLPSLI